MVKNKTLKTERGLIIASMGLAGIAYFLFELNMIDTVHDYYMMPFLPPLFILVVYGFKRLSTINFTTSNISILLILVLPIFAFKSVDNYWSIEKSYFNRDVLINKEELRKLIPNSEKCIILNDKSTYVFSYFIDKQGFIFWDDTLPTGWIEDMIQNYNVHYMYSDSRRVDTSLEFQQLIDSIIFEQGTVKVFKLKNIKY